MARLAGRHGCMRTLRLMLVLAAHLGVVAILCGSVLKGIVDRQGTIQLWAPVDEPRLTSPSPSHIPFPSTVDRMYAERGEIPLGFHVSCWVHARREQHQDWSGLVLELAISRTTRSGRVVEIKRKLPWGGSARYGLWRFSHEKEWFGMPADIRVLQFQVRCEPGRILILAGIWMVIY